MSTGARLGVLGVASIGVIGAADHFLPLVLLTATLGPTAYLLLAHPEHETARLRNAVIGHLTGVGAGLAALAMFGLWRIQQRPHLLTTDPQRLAAVAVAVGLTLLVLELASSHHAPAAATTILVASGLAGPGRPLVGLVLGVAGLLVVLAVLARVPVPRLASTSSARRGQ